MLTRKRCIGCNAPMPRAAADKGWEITTIGAKGKGQHTYRQCGCMARRQFLMWSNDLFDLGRDYPPRPWLKHLIQKGEADADKG